MVWKRFRIFAVEIRKKTMNRNICISKGCPFYHKSSKPRFKSNGMIDVTPRFVCGFYGKDITEVRECHRCEKDDCHIR